MRPGCPACQVRDLEPPMPWRDAAGFGIAHASAITAQAVGGLPRTLPLWVAAAAVTVTVGNLGGRSRHRPVCAGSVISATVLRGVALQVAWTTGFAVFSGVRTAARHARQSSENLVPLRISCSAGHRPVLASAHYAPRGTSWYVDGVFAWPRHRGGGTAIIERLLSRADAAGMPLTLTALSPRIAAAYRKVGFKYRGWIYYMRREPTRLTR